MKRTAFAALALVSAMTSAHAQNLSPDDLARRAIERRAVEAVIWGMPAVNYDLMYQAMVRETKGTFNQIVYWSRLPDWKNQTLTPNPDAIYLMPFFNTKEVGSVVLEIPPADEGSITGSIDDGWQAALEDVGPAGVDKGKGGKYLILPPGYAEKVPDGYIGLPSDTYQTYALLRSILKSGSETDIAKAVAYGKRRWKTSGLPGSTKVRAASTSFCRRATRRRYLIATSPCRRTLIKLTPCCVPF